MRTANSIGGLCALLACGLVQCSSSDDGSLTGSNTGSGGAAGATTSVTGASGTAAAAGTAATAPSTGSSGSAATGRSGAPAPAAGTGALPAAGRAAAGSGGAPAATSGRSGAPAATSGREAPAAGSGGSGSATPGMLAALPVALPNGDAGIGFDDMRYLPELKRLVVPAGRTGDVDLVDPLSGEVSVISGFTSTMSFTLGKHRNGSTSADFGAGKIFAIDNDSKTVKVIDAASNMVTFSSMLKAAPDYVRWVETTHEIWVTMPQNPGVSE